MDSKNYGVLWKVTDKAVNIFKTCEMEFLKCVGTFSYQINSQVLLLKLLKDCFIKSNFQHVCHAAAQRVDKEIAINLLEQLLLLYIRVRSHSYAKNKKEAHKARKKCTKKIIKDRNQTKKHLVALDLATENIQQSLGCPL